MEDDTSSPPSSPGGKKERISRRVKDPFEKTHPGRVDPLSEKVWNYCKDKMVGLQKIVDKNRLVALFA